MSIKTCSIVFSCVVVAFSVGGFLAYAESPQDPKESIIPNRFIEYDTFLGLSKEVQSYRANRRITEEQFTQMARDRSTIILDTRSKAKYDLLHVRGARHLNFSDITTETLQKVVPSKNTRILIYCNNNFENQKTAFPTKMAPAALNIPTFITLYTYGYKNIYELGPILDPANSRLEYTGTLKNRRRSGELPR